MQKKTQNKTGCAVEMKKQRGLREGTENNWEKKLSKTDVANLLCTWINKVNVHTQTHTPPINHNIWLINQALLHQQKPKSHLTFA